jgi:hypothetical protein
VVVAYKLLLSALERRHLGKLQNNKTFCRAEIIRPTFRCRQITPVKQTYECAVTSSTVKMREAESYMKEGNRH